MEPLNKKVWAIRTGDTIELRTGTAPRIIVSKLTKTVMLKPGETYTNEDGQIEFVRRRSRKKVVFTQTFFDGGTPLGLLTYSAYWTLFKGPPPTPHTMIQLSAQVAKLALSPAWRKKYLKRWD